MVKNKDFGVNVAVGVLQLECEGYGDVAKCVCAELRLLLWQLEYMTIEGWSKGEEREAMEAMADYCGHLRDVGGDDVCVREVRELVECCIVVLYGVFLPSADDVGRWVRWVDVYIMPAYLAWKALVEGYGMCVVVKRWGNSAEIYEVIKTNIHLAYMQLGMGDKCVAVRYVYMYMLGKASRLVDDEEVRARVMALVDREEIVGNEVCGGWVAKGDELVRELVEYRDGMIGEDDGEVLKEWLRVLIYEGKIADGVYVIRAKVKLLLSYTLYRLKLYIYGHTHAGNDVWYPFIEKVVETKSKPNKRPNAKKHHSFVEKIERLTSRE